MPPAASLTSVTFTPPPEKMVILHIFPVFARGYPAGSLKNLHKMLFVVVPDFRADFNDSQIRFRKQSLRFLHADSFQVIHKIAARILLKEIGKQGVIHGNMIRDHRHVQILIEVFLNVGNRLLDLLLVFTAVKTAVNPLVQRKEPLHKIRLPDRQ